MQNQDSVLMSNDPARAGENRVEEGRGIPQVGKQGGSKLLLGIGLVFAMFAVLAMAGFIAYKKFSTRPKAEEDKIETATETLPSLTEDAFQTKEAPPPPPGVEATAPAGAVATGPGQRAELTPEEKAARDRAERRKRAPVLVYSNANAAGAAGGSAAPASSSGGGGSSTLGRALQGTRPEGTAAATLADPNLTITQGTFIDCALQTAIDSTMPGMTSCVLTRDVYSTNGRVLLLERGSRLVGQYQSGQLKQGMRRIFVLWTRVETPNGVLINLDSPSTDALGRSGMDGRVNNHFWLRFGSAMLVSLVDDLAQYAVDQNRGSSGGTTIQFDSSSDSASRSAEIIVQNTVNIPPTLQKNQGAHVGIFVARDLYFGSVYGLSQHASRQ
jgi:type IV secretion system protein VirB10